MVFSEHISKVRHNFNPILIPCFSGFMLFRVQILLGPGFSVSGSRVRVQVLEAATANEFIFLQETHSCINDEIKWREEFKGELVFSHGKTNSRGVAIGFYGSKTIEQINKISDKSGRILLVEATVDDTVFVLINIYNANTESEQLETLLDLVSIIDKVKDIQSKNIVLGGDFDVVSLYISL